MGLDNVAVKWPRTGRFYDPVAPAEFVDFAGIGDRAPDVPRPAVALADHIAETAPLRSARSPSWWTCFSGSTVSSTRPMRPPKTKIR